MLTRAACLRPRFLGGSEFVAVGEGAASCFAAPFETAGGFDAAAGFGTSVTFAFASAGGAVSGETLASLDGCDSPSLASAGATTDGAATDGGFGDTDLDAPLLRFDVFATTGFTEGADGVCDALVALVALAGFSGFT